MFLFPRLRCIQFDLVRGDRLNYVLYDSMHFPEMHLKSGRLAYFLEHLIFVTLEPPLL